MTSRQNIIVLISNENYLRNWIAASAFTELAERYDLHYVVAKDYWDPEMIRNFGIDDFGVVEQANYRKFLLRRVLTVTMFKHTRRSKAFRIKMALVRQSLAPLYKFLALPGIYALFLAAVRAVLPTWPEFAAVVRRVRPVAIVAPSITADNFTIDMTHAAARLGVKSMILVNSWDNLVSKGVLPIAPDCVVVWGEQGVKHATYIQGIPSERAIPLGMARFERYFDESVDAAQVGALRALNGIPDGKKVILYAATALPFDDIAALEILDQAISSDRRLADYVILFRPHPEMMQRAAEKNFADCHFKNVLIDVQVSGFYSSRFEGEHKASFINDAELGYYPVLLRSIAVTVCPPTTLGLEGGINGVPCLMICYGDGKNTWLSPEKMCQYESVEDVLAMPGIVACRREEDLVEGLLEVIRLSEDPEARARLAEATRYVVHHDDKPYAVRLADLVDNLVAGRRLR